MSDEVRIIRERRPRAPRVAIASTPEIIERAIPKDSGHCVWADAVKAAVPTATGISVDLQTIRWSDKAKGCRYTYLTPRPVQVDLVNFDQGVKPVPMQIRLRGGLVTKMSPTRGATKPQKPLNSVSKTTLRQGEGSGAHGVLERVGGAAPPVSAYGHGRGRRREFGLRGLGRVTQPSGTDE